MEHNCCPHPFLRVEDSEGGKTAPSRSQCDCTCHDKVVLRRDVLTLIQDATERGEASVIAFVDTELGLGDGNEKDFLVIGPALHEQWRLYKEEL